MNRITLGKTGLVIEKNGFGCLPIQRISEQDAVKLLHKAYDGGIDFFDTARAYSDSEQKVGAAFSAMRDKIVLATKTGAQTAEEFWKDLETSLRTLKTDYIDLYQFHNPAFCPKPGGEDGLYDAALEAKKQGKIRHIAITNHRLTVVHEAIDSGLYETLQFPFSYLAGEQEMELVRKCRAQQMGFIAMKGMAGGLIRDGFTAAAWMAQQEGVVPIWGVQHESELDEFLQCIRDGIELTDARKARIERDRKELCGDFCRGCGYCMPCPAGIEINQCARMSLMLRRAPAAEWLTEEWQQKMHQIEQCLHCGHCMSKCPYGLNTPALLEANYKDYWEVLAASRAEKKMNLDFSERYATRPLTASDADAILTLCAENEQFYRYHPPLATKESVLEDLSALPPGKSAADKHYLSFFDGETLVAVLDLILDYPQEGTAYLGFFMTKKAVQGRGIGSALIGELLNELRKADCKKARLAVDRGNPQSKAFWEKNGFALTGEEVPHNASAYLPMERKI